MQWGNVGDPQLVRPERAEIPFDEVGRALLSRCTARGARGPGAADAAQTQVAHEAFDGAPGHVTGTVTLGGLGSVEHYMHLAGPQHRVVVLVDLGYLRLEGLVAQAPGARRPATAGVSHVLRGDLDSGASEHLTDRPGPELLLLGLDVLADQRDGRSHCAAIDKPTVLFRIALALHSSRTSLSSSLIRCASSVVVPGRVPWSIWAFLTQVRRASGWTPSSSAILRIAPLARAGSANASNARPRSSLAQLIGILLLSHDSDPSVSSPPPSNPGRFNLYRFAVGRSPNQRSPAPGCCG